MLLPWSVVALVLGGSTCTRGAPNCASRQGRPSAARADLRSGPRAHTLDRRTDSLARSQSARRVVDLRDGTWETGYRSLTTRTGSVDGFEVD